MKQIPQTTRSFSLELWLRRSRALPVLVLAAFCTACGGPESATTAQSVTGSEPAAALAGAATQPAAASAPVTAFVGAVVWDGTGAAAIEDASLIVRNGRIVSIQSGTEDLPDGAELVSLAGRFVIPGLIDAHAHVSGAWAPEGVEGDLARIRGDLDLYTRYGVTTVNSLGDGQTVIDARDAATAMDARTRLFAAGPVVTDFDPEAARASALANADAGVDWLKLRVDDNLGASQKMPWEAVRAVLDVGAARGLPTATHMFYLEDAKRLLAMGAGLIAHSVRDVDIDEEFLTQLRDSGVCYVPTLTRELSTFVYAERPEFFDDSFFSRYASMSEIQRVSDPAFMSRMAQSPAAARYRVALDQAMRNLKVVADAGLPVAMGTDAGVPERFPGYFEHMELWMMVDAGLTPEQALRSATAVAADCLNADDRGTLEPGKWADFVVLADDPLENIQATRSLEQVYIAGHAAP